MELVFGWGPTRCLGIRMANTNQSKFFVEVGLACVLAVYLLVSIFRVGKLTRIVCCRLGVATLGCCRDEAYQTVD